MKLGMVGLGRMGANMTERLVRAGHQVIGFDSLPSARQKVQAKGGVSADSLTELVKQLRAPRVVWLMVPSGDPVDQTIQALTSELSTGDVIVDGGNSNYRDSLRRAEALKSKGIHFVDVGVSGGIWGLKEGYSMMIGGDADAVTRLKPIFEALAPGKDKGWGHVGPVGSGHFVKMVHNGIEYALMEAYAEGFELMRQKKDFNLNLGQIAEVWRFGSVVRSWLLDLIAEALEENPKLEGIAGYVPDSGEGRWTVVESIDLGCPLPVISLALNRRFLSQEQEPFAEKLLAMMRRKFGGHAVKAA
jgi:6-phosphogluconate dehydrogenase